MKIIHTDNAPKAVGAYSQAIVTQNLVFTAGQIGIDPQKDELTAGIEEQTQQVIKNLSAVLEKAGSSLEKVIKTTCFLKNITDYQKFNEIYAEFFIGNPARSTVEVAKLPKNALIEIEAIAEIN